MLKLIIAAIIGIAGGALSAMFLHFTFAQFVAMSFSMFLFTGWLIGRIRNEPIPLLDNPRFGIIATVILLIITVLAFWRAPDTGAYIEMVSSPHPHREPSVSDIKLPRFVSASIVILIAAPYAVESVMKLISRR